MTRKNIVTFIVVFLFIWLLGPVVRNIYWYQMNPFKAIMASLLDKTNWSPNYSEKAFNSIEVGFTTEAVKKLLGPALYITDKDNETIWHYTVGPNQKPQSLSNGSTHVRSVWFDKNLKVVRKTKYYYFD